MVTIGDGTCMEEATKRTATASLLLSFDEGECEGHFFFTPRKTKASGKCVELALSIAWSTFCELNLYVCIIINIGVCVSVT